MAGIELHSSAFNDHDLMPDRYSRPDGNVSPPLEWSAVPEDTAELILLCEDPDAGRQPFLHWLVTGIDPNTRSVAEGDQIADARQWRNGFGFAGWGGPQPPVGDDPHRYFFHLYALAEPLTLGEQPTADDVRRAAEPRKLASGTTVGLFAR